MDKYHYPPDMGDTEQNSNDDIRPRIIITGLKRSGKSSIHKVVFHKMSPNETVFLESHNKALSDSVQNNSFIRFNIWEFPEHPDDQDQRDFELAVLSSGALVFVIDSQDEYGDALAALNSIVRKAHGINPNMNFEVFIHKVDGLSDDHKIEARQEIHQRANEDLIEQVDEILLSFYLTSIYDHSIFEAFSKVVQKLIPQMPILENLLNVLISNSGIEKAFLFDATSKIFVATDSSPVDMQSYELCCDMIDVVMDISCIYGYDENIENRYKGTSASIRLNSGTVLYLREVNHYLALVCILREDNFNKQGLIDYNFQCFRQSIQDVFNFGATVKEEKEVNLANESPYGSAAVYANGTDQHQAYSTEGELSTSLENVERRTSTPIQNNYKLSSPQMSPAAPMHRKAPIVPTNSIPSSLPNHQPTFHVSPSGADKAKLHLQSPIFGAYSNGPISERRLIN